MKHPNLLRNEIIRYLNSPIKTSEIWTDTKFEAKFAMFTTTNDKRSNMLGLNKLENPLHSAVQYRTFVRFNAYSCISDTNGEILHYLQPNDVVSNISSNRIMLGNVEILDFGPHHHICERDPTYGTSTGG